MKENTNTILKNLLKGVIVFSLGLLLFGLNSKVNANTNENDDITIEVHTVLYGDVNLDSKVNIKDVTYLQRYLSPDFEEYGLNFEAKANADVNLDNIINQSDIDILQKYIAGGWYDSLPVQNINGNNISIIHGDVSLDGNVNILDLLYLKRFSHNLQYLSDEAKSNSDVNLDGNITQEDVYILSDFLIKKVSSLPIKESHTWLTNYIPGFEIKYPSNWSVKPIEHNNIFGEKSLIITSDTGIKITYYIPIHSEYSNYTDLFKSESQKEGVTYFNEMGEMGYNSESEYVSFKGMVFNTHSKNSKINYYNLNNGWVTKVCVEHDDSVSFDDFDTIDTIMTHISLDSL